jgi:L,D-transpeptidase catalytic domain
MAVAGGFVLTSGAGLVFARDIVEEIAELKPGEYTWHPERAPEGPVAIVVSLPEQRVHVYRNGVRIAVSTCSSGKPGHETPTGIFTILQKDKHHHSSTYNNAPVPNMNRLTWQGVALHAGNLPGYPASHGCVRLPLDFSEKLFTVTHIGTPVIIAGSHTDPYELTHPGMVLGDYTETEMEDAVNALDGKSHPKDWDDGEAYPVTTVIASSNDRTITLFENGRDIAAGKLTIKGSPKLGEHVFTLQGARGNGLAWHGISRHEDPEFPHVREEALITRISADKAFVGKLQQHMHPGMMMIVTDIPAHPDRRSDEDFVIMTVS